MLRTISTISEFKEIANMTHDNSEIASKNWGKTWGLGCWFDLWFYKEYTFGTLMYRTGQAVFRHYKQSIKKYYINEEEVTAKEFFEHASKIKYVSKILTSEVNKQKYTEGNLFNEY